MPKIFISYRRKDSLLHAGRIFDQLALHFDSKDIFMDFNISTGGDFPQNLQDAVQNCDVCLVIIGKDWATITDDAGKRLLENADDWVRFEVRMALARHTKKLWNINKKRCVVMPILVGGASPLDATLLPHDLRKLSDLNTLTISDFQHDFYNNIAQLVANIHAIVGKPALTSRPNIDVFVTFGAFEEAYNAKKWYESRRLLAQLRSVDNLPITIISSLDNSEKEVWDAINREVFEKERDKEYRILRSSATGDKKRFRTAYNAFSRAYPNYDPDPLGHFASHVYDLLPQPFEWVHIPAGKVLLTPDDIDKEKSYLKEATIFDIPAFSIAKYPVTNAQYEVFITHPDGYKNPKWWEYSDEAKEWRAGRQEMNPSKFDGYNCPRESVSWYDSVAFCLWLSAITGENITLPTEQQWQRAAVGDTKNIYPWGNKIDKTYANYGGSIGRTTPVTQYSKGASPFGVMDMGGNVWQWCLTVYKSGDISLTGDGGRVVRGGSWSFDSEYTFISCRNGYAPDISFDDFGFFVVYRPY
jgi:formylglycine-generating enzyme required for sulfatase activity